MISEYGSIRFLKGLLSLVDIEGWQKWFGAAVLGFAYALDLNNNYSPVQFQGLVIGTAFTLCYIQSLNDYFDVEIDKTKQKIMGKELIVSNIISRRTALAIAFSVLLIGLVSAGITSVNLLALTLLAAFFGTIYSAPPFRLKMKYPFSTLIQFASCFLPFLAGVASISTVTFQTILISSIFAVLTIFHRFVHEFQNYRADLLTAKGTVAVRKGLKTAETLCKLSALVGIIEFLVFFVLGWFTIVFLFLFVLFLIISVVPWNLLKYMPQPVKTIFTPVILVSGFVLLFATLLLHGKILPLM